MGKGDEQGMTDIADTYIFGFVSGVLFLALFLAVLELLGV